jgi:hypothetical protein
MTDTSYFPTEDLDGVPDQQPDQGGAGQAKDLAFLGYSSSFSLLPRFDSSFSSRLF